MTTAGTRPGSGIDILVVGAGAVGLVAAIGLARAGWRTTLLGQPGEARPCRTVALLQGSVDVLRSLDIWPGLDVQAEALRTMRVVDATGSIFAPPPVSFRAAEIGLTAFGYNVDNAVLENALRSSAATTPGLAIIPETARSVSFTRDAVEVSTGTGTILRCALLAAADGRDSMARKASRIGVRTTTHPQRAMTAILHHGAPHDNVSTEFHTREGPFTLVPMVGAAGRRSSLVWVMSPAAAARRRVLAPEAFTREAEDLCGRLLGPMTLESAIGSFPIVTRTASSLTAPRLVLLGEAAHALPPIGAQGLNLSFRDAAALIENLRPGRGVHEDAGRPDRLAAYEAQRRGDVASRVAAVDMLNGSLLAHGLGMDLVRGAGLTALGRLGPLRRFVMRHGLAPSARLPSHSGLG